MLIRFGFFIFLFGFYSFLISQELSNSERKAFETFFETPYKDVKKTSKIKIKTAAIVENSMLFQVKLEFDIKNIDKVLVLKEPTRNSSLSACRNESVFISSYIINPKKKVKSLSFRMSSCCQHNRDLVLRLYVRTTENNYYTNNVVFSTTTSSGFTSASRCYGEEAQHYGGEGYTIKKDDPTVLVPIGSKGALIK